MLYNAFGETPVCCFYDLLRFALFLGNVAQDAVDYFNVCKTVLEAQGFLRTLADVHGANSTKCRTLVYIRMSH